MSRVKRRLRNRDEIYSKVLHACIFTGFTEQAYWLWKWVHNPANNCFTIEWIGDIRAHPNKFGMLILNYEKRIQIKHVDDMATLVVTTNKPLCLDRN